MGQQWERSLFCQFQLLGSHWEVHWLKLTPGLNRVLGGKTTPPNIFFRPILPKFEEIFEIVVGDFERWPMLPVRKTTPLSWKTVILSSCMLFDNGKVINKERREKKLDINIIVPNCPPKQANLTLFCAMLSLSHPKHQIVPQKTSNTLLSFHFYFNSNKRTQA